MERSKSNRILVAVGLALVVGAVALYLYRSRATGPPAAEPVATTPAPAEPLIEHPLPAVTDATPATPLPPLAASDAPLATDLGALFGAESVATWLVPETLVRRLVVTVDNLPRGKLPSRLRPVKPIEGLFAVNRVAATEPGADDVITLADENYGRYEALLRLLSAADMQQVARVYTRYYPLFQQSYEELGYPKQYFNDRLVAVIDHLLQTPELSGPVKLVQPNVFYQFADPAIEARSTGQKLLLRIGPKNAGIVKTKLRELRAAVTATKPAA